LSKPGSNVIDGLVTDMNVIIAIMVAQCVIFSALTLLIDTYRFQNFKNVKKPLAKVALQQPILNAGGALPGIFLYIFHFINFVSDHVVFSNPTDIANEEERVKLSKDPIRIVDLTKTYENGFQAINGVSFGVEKNQIFGLLGPNGAG